MKRVWLQPLQELFACLSQDPIEDAPSMMAITGTAEEQRRWFGLLDSAIQAAEDNDNAVTSIFSENSGYRATTPEQAKLLLVELRTLYSQEIET